MNEKFELPLIIDDADCNTFELDVWEGRLTVEFLDGSIRPKKISLDNATTRAIASEIFKAQGVTVIECPHKIGDTIWVVQPVYNDYPSRKVSHYEIEKTEVNFIVVYPKDIHLSVSGGPRYLSLKSDEYTICKSEADAEAERKERNGES